MSSHPFRTSSNSGVYYLPPARQSAVERAAEKEGLLLLKAGLSPRTSKENALARLGDDLRFPDWYGANFDALFDCLTDADWQPAKGHVLVIQEIAELRTTNPDDFTTLIEVFKAAADARKDADSAFWILLDSPARGIPPFPEA